MLAILGTFYDYFVYQKALKKAADKSESDFFAAQGSIQRSCKFDLLNLRFQRHLQRSAWLSHFTRMVNGY